MAKRKLTFLVFLEAAVLSIFYCTPVEATNDTISRCPTDFGCVCVSPSDVTCTGVPGVPGVPGVRMLDLRENRLQEFTVGSFTQFTGPSFSSLLLEDNQIQTVSGVTRPRFTRESFPVLTIHLSGNTPPCEAEFFVSLCPFLEDGDAMCTEGTELLTIQPDVCLGLNMPDAESNPTPNSGVIIGGVVGGVLGILLVILLLALLVVCFRLKMWKKKLDDCARPQPQQKTQQFIRIPEPPTRPRSNSPRYIGCPEQQCRAGPGAKGDQESIYEDIDFPSRRPLPDIPVEESSYDSNGYIFRIDSIPLQPTEQDKQVSVLLEGPLGGARPQVCEEPVNTLSGETDSEEAEDRKSKPSTDSADEKKADLVVSLDDSKEEERVSVKAENEGLQKTPSSDDKKEQNPVYLQLIA